MIAAKETKTTPNLCVSVLALWRAVAKVETTSMERTGRADDTPRRRLEMGSRWSVCKVLWRSSGSGRSVASGEAEAVALVEDPRVMDECRLRVGRSPDQVDHERPERPAVFRCLRSWLEKPAAQPRQVPSDLRRARLESMVKGLCLRDAEAAPAGSADRRKKPQTLERQGHQEDPENGGPVNPARQTEVRQERDRLLFPCTVEAADPDLLGPLDVGDDHLPRVPAVTAEPVKVAAEKAAAILGRQHHLRVLEVRVDAAWNTTYSLHVLTYFLGRPARRPRKLCDPHSFNYGGHFLSRRLTIGQGTPYAAPGRS